MKYIPTGNEYVTLDRIGEEDAGLEAVSVLHMGYKGILQIAGGAEKKLLRPYFVCGGERVGLKRLCWERKYNWLPHFCYEDEKCVLEGTLFAPPGERGFFYSLTLTNKAGEPLSVSLGLEGSIHALNHIINETRQMNVRKETKNSNWNHSVVFSFVGETDILAFAPIFEEGGEAVTADVTQSGYDTEYCFYRSKELAPGEEMRFDGIWGLGYEEVSAATSAKELLRHGYEWEYRHTAQKLEKLCTARKTKQDLPEAIQNISDTNALFCYYYASGRTIDTEEAVLVTSRSDRYYVSAAFWDRDALLWAFPCILEMDQVYARELLLYVFGRQRRNFGMHSRYIDGTLLEPGFELDELAAPIYALTEYCLSTKDTGILAHTFVEEGIRLVLERLETYKHPHTDLYETFLLPSDDEAEYFYVTYDNALLSISLERLGRVLQNEGQTKRAGEILDKADRIKKAVWEHCVTEKDEKRIFAWAVDLNGNAQIYDEPPGSLQLLAYYGFVGGEDEVYRNTMGLIRGNQYRYSFAGCYIDEIGCAHAEHPWILSLANSLLCGDRQHALSLLTKMSMDNGIACESVYEGDGTCATGDAFGTCAGFLAYAINRPSL